MQFLLKLTHTAIVGQLIHVELFVSEISSVAAGEKTNI